MNEWLSYTCKTCKKGWQTNEGIKDECPICRGEINEYYQRIK